MRNRLRNKLIKGRLLEILIIAIMALTAVLPMASADNGSEAIAWWPDEGGATPQNADATGAVTYDTEGGGEGGQGTDAPLKILAIWETGEEYLDADETQIGCQIDPPMIFEGWVTVKAFVVIEDPDGVLPPENSVKIDVSWPDNSDICPDLGMGGIPDKWDNIEPVNDGTWVLDYLPAHNIDLYNMFICYYDGANDGIDLEGYDYLEWAYGEGNLIIKWVEFDLYYHDPAGWYDVHVAVQGPTVDQQMNYFEYDMGIGVEIDFDYLDWGTKIDINRWYDYDGNEAFDPDEQDYLGKQRPTVRNIGNWDAELGVRFGNGDFDPAYVLFDARIGYSNPEAPGYNPSIRERDHPDGLLPNVDYWPFPINNYDELGYDCRNDAVLKCHTYKMDFYLNPLQWNLGEDLYEFPIIIFVNPPDWEPAEEDPCPNVVIYRADIAVEKTVNESNPPIDTNITYTITATNYGPDDATDVAVEDILPESLTYVSHVVTQGTYDNETGIWNIGDLAYLQSETLDISATVTAQGTTLGFTQLALILDGSNSISRDDWDIMITGLAEAIEDETIFPHDDSVELTIIQFGDYQASDPHAQVEIPPTIINDTNFESIADDIRAIIQLGGATPLGCGIRLTADQLRDVGSFNPDYRQVINLVTDGIPNCEWIPGTYTGTWKNPAVFGYGPGKTSAEEARTYMINELEMTEDQDEFDVEAIGDEPDINWLLNNIAWPQPGYDNWPPTGSGWVKQISDYSEFVEIIGQKFVILFDSITNYAEVINSNPLDQYTLNDIASASITPQPPEPEP
jgi:uncharacterized repeat protein (TIGR01451 family)